MLSDLRWVSGCTSGGGMRNHRGRSRWSWRPLAGLLTMLLASTVGAQTPTPKATASPVLVRIGGFTMTLSEFEALYARLAPETRAHYESQGGGGKRAFLQD